MFERLAKNPNTALITIAVLIFISIPLQIKIDNIRGKFRLIQQTLFLSPSSLKKLSLGYEQMLADIYWLRAIQYFGSDKVDMTEKDPETLYQYFDIITDLDPKFVNAYRFGGTFLGEPIPMGLGDLERAFKLYDKGRKNNPDNFRLPLEQAFLYYLYTDQYKKSAELFREAADKPGLSDFRSATIRGMAAAALSRGGERDMAKQIWKYIYETTDNEGRREFALRNLKEINTKEKEEELTKILREYIQKTNNIPDDLEALLENGYINEIPRDHAGNEFIISKRLRAVKSPTLARQQLESSVGYYTSMAHRYRRNYGQFPDNFEQLKQFIKENEMFQQYKPHPLGGEYKYDPETGKVTYDESILE